MAKIVSSYVNDESARALVDYCSSHGCTQSSALASLLRGSQEPVFRIVKDPDPINDVVNRTIHNMVHEAYQPRKVLA